MIEAATESEWVARHLEALGHQVIIADPNFAPMYASRSRKVKTDKRDARALCEACHLGAYRVVHRVSDGSRLLRKQLAIRAVLVQTRSRMISLGRALLRQEGIRVPSGGATAFDKRVRALSLNAELRRTLQPLLKTHAQLVGGEPYAMDLLTILRHISERSAAKKSQRRSVHSRV